MKKALFIVTVLFFLIGGFAMADNRQAPRLINLQGISYYIYGDPGSEQAKQLMAIATKDLKGLKGRNINNLDTIEFTRPPYAHVRSRFGKDEIFIYPDVGVIKEGLIEKIVIEKKREDIRIEYLPTFEAYDVNGDKIGYIVCLGGTFDSGYELVITENVIGAKATKEQVAAIREENPAITVDPFMFPVWKYWYCYEYGVAENRPFVEPELLDKEILRQYRKISDEEKEIIYEDVACTFEDMTLRDDDWVDYEEDRTAGWGEMQLYWLPYYRCIPCRWTCFGVWGARNTYNGHNNYIKPNQYIHVTEDGWTGNMTISDLPSIPESAHCHNEIIENISGSWGGQMSICSGMGPGDPCGEDAFPYQGDEGGEQICNYGAGFNGEWAYWCISGIYPEVEYGGWCDAYG